MGNELEVIERDAVAVTSGTVVVDSPESRIAALEDLKQVKATIGRVKDYWAPLKKDAHDSWKGVVARESQMLKPLGAKEVEIKRVVLDYDQRVERERQAEQARLQAKADEQARIERERALKAAERLKTPELREQRIAEAESIVAPAVLVPKQETQTEGVSTAKRWKAELLSKQELVMSAAKGNGLAMALLCFDQVAANRQAVASKDNIKVPGVRFYAEEQLRVSK